MEQAVREKYRFTGQEEMLATVEKALVEISPTRVSWKEDGLHGILFSSMIEGHQEELSGSTR
jgi:hypothetical protein